MRIKAKVKVQHDLDLFRVGEVVYITDISGHRWSMMEITDSVYTDTIDLDQLALSIRGLVQVKLIVALQKIIRHEN